MLPTPSSFLLIGAGGKRETGFGTLVAPFKKEAFAAYFEASEGPHPKLVSVDVDDHPLIAPGIVDRRGRRIAHFQRITPPPLGSRAFQRF